MLIPQRVFAQRLKYRRMNYNQLKQVGRTTSCSNATSVITMSNSQACVLSTRTKLNGYSVKNIISTNRLPNQPGPTKCYKMKLLYELMEQH